MSNPPDLLATGTLTWETTALVERLPGDGRVDMEGIEAVLARAITRVDGGGGSAGNVATAVASTGLHVVFAGQVGDDEEGNRCVAALVSAGVESLVRQVPGRRTKRSVILVEAVSGRVEFHVDVPARSCPPLEASAVPGDLVQNARWLHLDRASPAAEEFLKRRASNVSSMDIHDIPRRPLALSRLKRLLGCLGLLQIREDALFGLLEHAWTEERSSSGCPHAGSNDTSLGANLTPRATIEECLLWLSARIHRVIVTRGSLGAMAIESGRLPFQIPPAAPVMMIDPTGAGDAFAAALLTGILTGHQFESCCHEASFAGAAACTWLGARRPSERPR
jgi:sugar/nucleoside kinase (ribokinase family)